MEEIVCLDSLNTACIGPVTTDSLARKTKTKEENKEETEKRLDDVLREGDYQSIEEHVTPKTLTSCKTNTLIKAFEVNKTLRDLVKSAVNPEIDEMETLSTLLDEFTCALVDPLRTDSDTRNTFKSCFDYVVNKAIDTEQKKFVSHPVVFNLMTSKYYRSFTSERKKPWTSLKRWGYLFLNVWTVLDMFFFPLFFALFSVVHFVNKKLRKTTETEICFILAMTKGLKDAVRTEEVFNLIKKTISYTIHEHGFHFAKYSFILREEDNALRAINGENAVLDRVESIQKSDFPPRLYEDLCSACDAFKSAGDPLATKKILVVFTNDTLSKVCPGNPNLSHVVCELNEKLGVKIVPIGIGEKVNPSELRKISGKNTTTAHFGEYEAPKTLGKTIIHGADGKDIYDLYLDYFTTPYFICLRDSLSYLTLLGLNSYLCLTPPTIAFSRVEWAIFVFFVARTLVEIDQFMGAKIAEKKATKQRLLHGSTYVNLPSPPEKRETAKSASANLLKGFSKYFSDLWNRLDFVIVVTYVVTFILRMFTWATSVAVANNRPLAVAGCLYGFITMFLALRTFGHVMECTRGMGPTQIALFFIIWDVLVIFWQFVATIVAFSLVITKIFVSEKYYLSNGKTHGSLACDDDGYVCLEKMTPHLAFSLLGVTGLDEFKSVDPASELMAKLLYAIFLIMGVILLINMMIALLSNTYQHVQDHSQSEWCFKKAITMRTYSSYHPVPVPFNLLSIPFMVIWKLCQKCVAEKYRFTQSGCDESGKKAALDLLVKRLKRIYFATHGFSFPLTDENKMDKLLKETDGNRRLANRIVQRVFTPQDKCFMIKGPTAWESLGIEIKDCLLRYEGADSCAECKEKEKTEKIHGARYLMPFTRETPRIEVLIQEIGERCILGVGAVFKCYNCHRMPGKEGGTVGYRVEDGKLFKPGCEKLGEEIPDAMARRGDLIACEVNFDGATDDTIPVVFFLNGREIARASMMCTAGQARPFPYISMGIKGIQVLAQICPRDSGVRQLSVAAPEVPLTKVSWSERHSSLIVQEQYIKLKEDMEAMKRGRRAQAKEFQEKLDNQWKILTEMSTQIQNLVMISGPKESVQERADGAVFLGSEQSVETESVL